MLDEQFQIEQAPEQGHRLAGKFGLDLIGCAFDRNGCVSSDRPSFRLARKGAEPLPRGTWLAPRQAEGFRL